MKKVVPISILFIVTTMMFVSCFGYDDESIKIVKEGHFQSYPNKAIGKTLENYYDSVTWESGIPEDDDLRLSGKTLVNCECRFKNENGRNNVVMIQFLVHEESGSFDIAAMSANGEYLDKWQIHLFIDVVFGNADEDESNADEDKTVKKVSLTKAEDFNCKLTDDATGVIIIGAKSAEENTVEKVVIPPTIEDIPVKAVYFEDYKSLKSVKLPETVEYFSFSGCKNLESVKLPSAFKELSGDAFNGCENLTNIVLPETLLKIVDSYGDAKAFKDCTSLEKINIPSSLECIPNYTFQGCSSLKEIIIPDGITKIGNAAFQGCTSLKEIVISDGITKIGESAFNGCTSLEKVNIPASLEYIDGYTFRDCTSLREIVIPDGITEIGVSAFNGCTSLEKVWFPASLTLIGAKSFEGCSSLKEIIIDENITKIDFYDDFQYGETAFNGCSSLPLKTQAKLKQLGYRGNF